MIDALLSIDQEHERGVQVATDSGLKESDHYTEQQQSKSQKQSGVKYLSDASVANEDDLEKLLAHVDAEAELRIIAW